MNERDDDLMRRFLAGGVTDEERDAVEQRFMDDAGFFERLASLEHEMMVDLVEGRLPARWAGPFRATIAAAPDRQRRLEEVRALLDAMSPSGGTVSRPAASTQRLGWMVLAASLVIVAGGAVLLQQRATIGAPPAGDSPQVSAPPPIVLTAVLRPGPARSASDTLNQVSVAADVSRLRLVSVLDTSVPGPVEAQMRAVGGAGLELPPATQSRVTNEGLEVVWELPASAVDVGDYLITYSRDDAGSARILGTRFVRITK